MLHERNAVEKLSMPKTAVVLNVAMMDGKLCLWAEVWDPKEPEIEKEFLIVGTGVPFEDLMLGKEIRQYIGTVIEKSMWVWHIHEIKNTGDRDG
jgi:hypothetical protein